MNGVRSLEALNISLDTGNIDAALNILTDTANPVTKNQEPFVRTNVPQNDFTPQGAYLDLAKNVQVSEEVTIGKNKVHLFDKEISLGAIERIYSILSIDLWEQAQRKSDCEANISQQFLMGERLMELIQVDRDDDPVYDKACGTKIEPFIDWFFRK